ncbi:MAG: right-handed parallel beta-helix repeat-containing protein [Thermoplasmatales archaeon]|nr:MAG: right-handed parallel beta-helix repeat-containing protein [Thermoplasmatales archaeon]
MQNPYVKNGLAFVIIILFIGLTLTPGVNANIETSTAPNLNKHSQKLTEEELYELRYVDIPMRYRYITEDGQIHTVTKSRSEVLAERAQYYEEKDLSLISTNIGNGNHSPIYIDGNDDFTEENGVTGGSGTENDPYIIENWVIVYDGVAENGIFITNTDAYFIIRNCTVRSFTPEGYLGIRFNNVKNGRIEDTEAFWNYAGIGIWDSEYVTIFNCTSHDNKGWYARGVFCSSCSNITISSCEFYNNNGETANGIELYRCSYCVIENTSSFNNDWHGLEIGHGHPPEDFQNLCKHNIIRDCKFYKNLLNGICFYSNRRLFFKYKGPSYNQIIRCEVYDNGHCPGDGNGFEGIRIDGYYNGVVIEDCDIHDNEYGITISVSSYNIIRNCRIYNNIDETDYIGWGVLIGGVFLGEILGAGEWAVNNEIVNCDIYNNEMGIWLCETFKSNVHKNNIYNNSFFGIAVDNFNGISAAVNINYNNIYDNGFETNYACGMMILERSICDARYNWWGADNGPKIFWYIYSKNICIPLRPWGDGDRIGRGRCILFLRPWEKEPIPDAGRQ